MKINTKQKYLDEIIIEISKIQKELLDSSLRIMEAGNKKLYTLDFFALTVNNRAISLTNAYLTLIKENNYLTAVSLIRLQLDNALRFFASTLVEDSYDFVSHFLNGKEINNYKDYKNNKLTDGYLAAQLDTYFKGTLKLYKETCGFIHLSDRHFLPIIKKKEKEIEKKSIGIYIGSSDNFSLDQKIDFTNTMFEVTKLVIIIIEQWKHEKNKLGVIYDNSARPAANTGQKP